ncbi:amino acid ABC transporter permease [Glycomyces xiaoerkulensis]|uniref:amino acid ABC transporter permease n=1 Tax=Glycomyces xiaoerkulensis TaxID=2038139 RepID=UPI0018E44706|nr:amino acid ABC transporter permease [Glycomyces xiaoerkulensis]
MAVQTRGRLTPRGRRRLARATQYTVVMAAIAVAAALADWGRIAESFLRADIAAAMFPQVWTAFGNTVAYTLLAFASGMVVGVPIALMRTSGFGPYRWFATAYVELFRGLPALLVLFLVGFGVPQAFPGLQYPGGVYGQVALGLGLTSSAYIAESVRAGIQAVPRGQVEAARSLGMSHTRTMVTVVLPQAIRIVVPPLTNELVLLTKDSSLVFVLGVTTGTMELTRFARAELTANANATPLLIGGLLYLLVTVPLSTLARRLEDKEGRG